MIMNPHHHRFKAIEIVFLSTIFALTKCDGQSQSQQSESQYEKVFRIAIIIGGYVAVIIGAVIFRMEARQSKVIQFQQVLAKASISSTEHKFETLHQENQISVKKSPVEYESTGGDSTRRKKRKRKADRLSDRRRSNQSNQSNQNNQQGED